MDESQPRDVTRILARIGQGDAQATSCNWSTSRTRTATDPALVDTDGANLNDFIDPDPCTPNRVMVAAGADSSCAIKTDGSLWAWGDNDHGQLEPVSIMSLIRE